MSVEQRTAIKFCVLNGKKQKRNYGNSGQCIWRCCNAENGMHCISGTRGMKTDMKV